MPYSSARGSGAAGFLPTCIERGIPAVLKIGLVPFLQNSYRNKFIEHSIESIADWMHRMKNMLGVSLKINLRIHDAKDASQNGASGLDIGPIRQLLSKRAHVVTLS